MKQEETLYTFVVYSRPEHVPGKVYLGVFLAFVLFFAFVFGNILFFTITVMITFLIFLSKDREDDKIVNILEHSIHYGNKIYYFKDILSYSFIDEIFDKYKPFLQLTFKSVLFQNLYIELEEHVNIDLVKNALEKNTKNLKENKEPKISLVDEIILGFFH